VIVQGSVITGQLAAGVIYAGNIDAAQIKTGAMQVGGNSQAGQIFVNRGDGVNIGWIGTYAGWEGAWFKRVQLGGTSPANAKIACDVDGNLTIQNGASLTAPNILSAQINTSTISGGNISGATLTLFHGVTGTTTSIQTQNGNAPVTNTYTGIRVSHTNGDWAGMSQLGTGQFTANNGYAITFSDAFQVYDTPSYGAAVMVRLGVDRATRTPGLWFNGVKVLNARFTEPVDDLPSLIRCLRHHGLCN
jgi:hypothetical protein